MEIFTIINHENLHFTYIHEFIDS